MVGLFFLLLAFIGTTGYYRFARPRYFESMIAPALLASGSLIVMAAMIGGWRFDWRLAGGLLIGFVLASLLQVIGIARRHARWRRGQNA